jgi:hypothetical protein
MSSETANASLEQIAESGIAIAWYEAVAMVQQICCTLFDQPGQFSLDPADIFIQATGDVTIQSSGTGGDEAVQSLGELLRSWLADSACPIPLRLVVAQATCTPPFYTSTSALFEALSYYERQNRQDLIRAVYEHWRSTVSVSEEPGQNAILPSTGTLQERLRSLGEAARSSCQELLANAGERWKSMRAPAMQAPPDATPQETLETAPPQIVQTPGIFPPAWWDWHLAITAAAIAVLVASSNWLLVSFGPTAATRAGVTIHRTGDRLADRVAVPLGGAFNWLVRQSPSQPAIRPSPSPTRVSSRREPRAEFQPLVIERAGPSGPSQPAGALSSPQTSLAAQQRRVDPRLPDAVVYSATDVDVVPPGIIDQELSDSPPAAQQRRFTALTIVVDENGHVETVTLATKPATFQDIMLATMNMSAAKSWRFLPAVKDGQPVKYRRTIWVANR